MRNYFTKNVLPMNDSLFLKKWVCNVFYKIYDGVLNSESLETLKKPINHNAL